MKDLTTLISIITLGLFACEPNKNSTSTIKEGEIKIEWSNHLTGDYTFQNQWSYPEGIYKNEFGQLSCEGICPEESEAMKDSKGKIYNDSLKAFYRLVDTTHQFHTIQCEAWCYEWGGTNFIEAKQKTKDTIECYTLGNAATHCSLHLYIVKNICLPIIELKSIVANGNAVYPCTDGFIKIDKEYFEKGIIKADFNFNFKHKENPKQPMYWKGKIYTKIKNT